MSASEENSWLAYNDWNARHPGMSQIWVGPLAVWLESKKELLPAHFSVLDYGCGYFDLGRVLAHRFAAFDGFDPHAPSLSYAENLGLPQNSALFTDKAQIPERKYQLLVLHSVVQYFAGKSELEEFFGFAARVLSGPRAYILLSDLIPRKFNAPLSALHSLGFAAKAGLLLPWAKHLWKAATKPPGLELWQVDPAEIAALAQAHGYRCRLLDQNLSPGRGRYSLLLERMSS